nr:hypothetical protein [Mycoplasmopsis bovis]
MFSLTSFTLAVYSSNHLLYWKLFAQLLADALSFKSDSFKSVNVLSKTLKSNFKVLNLLIIFALVSLWLAVSFKSLSTTVNALTNELQNGWLFNSEALNAWINSSITTWLRTLYYTLKIIIRFRSTNFISILNNNVIS